MTSLDKSPHYWTAALATTMRHAIDSPENSRSLLATMLDRFRRSSCCTPELRAQLRTVPIRPIPKERRR